MTPNIRLRTLALALCALSVAPSALAARRTDADDAPRVADLSAEFSRLFPATTLGYAEIPHLATLVTSLGLGDRLLEFSNARLAGADAVTAERTGKPAPAAAKAGAKPAPTLSSKEMSLLLDTSVAVGYVKGGGVEDVSSVAVVLRMSGPEGPALLRDRVFARFGAPLATSKVDGVDVTRMPTFSYAISGRNVLVGGDDSVRSVLDTAASGAARLGDDPGFASAAAKHSGGQDQAFVFVAGRVAGGIFGGGVLGVGAEAPDGKEPPYVTAMRTFVGITAVQGVAAGVRFDPDATRIRYDLELDRTKPGLVTTLADPPSISFKAPLLLPGDADRLTIFSLDAARIYDLLEQAFAPVPPQNGRRPFIDDVAEAEQYLGVSVRGELIPALGTEVAFTGTLDSVFGGGGPRDGDGGKRPLNALVLQVRNPEVIRKVILHLMAQATQKAGAPDVDVPSVVYKGAEIFEAPGFGGVALGKDFVIFGQKADLQRCLDAQEVGTVLAKAPDFASVAGGWAGDTILATYETAEYREAAARAEAARDEEMRKRMGEYAESEDFQANNLVTTMLTSIPRIVQRDGSGVHWEATAPTAPLSGLVAYALKQMLRAAPEAEPSPSEDNRMVGLLYEIASAEASFRNEKERFATLDELVAEGDLAEADVAETAKRAGYHLTISPIGTGDGSRFEAVAIPVEYGKPAKLSFFVDESFVIRAADKAGAPASASDTPFSYDMSRPAQAAPTVEPATDPGDASPTTAEPATVETAPESAEAPVVEAPVEAVPAETEPAPEAEPVPESPPNE